MEQQAIRQAIEMLRQRGEEPSARKIRKVLLEMGQGCSYRDIYRHLHGVGLGDEPPAPDDEAEPDAVPDAVEADEVPDDEADELPPAAVIARAEAMLQQAQQRVTTIEAQLPELVAASEQAREAVLVVVSRQLAAKECRWRSYWPSEDEPVLQAIHAEVAATASAYRQAREAVAQARRALVDARQTVYQAEHALTQARHEASVRQHAPALWRRRQAAIAARDRDPRLNDYREPGASIRSRARHQQAIERIEQEIEAALATAAGV